MINDKSFVAIERVNNEFWVNLIHKIPILSPSSTFVYFWNMVLYLAISFKIFEIPLVLGFEIEDEHRILY